MAQANPFDQFDSQQAPVPLAQIRPIIAAPRDPNEAAQEAREQARFEKEMAGGDKTTFRAMTPEEVAAQGLPPGAYQVSSQGEVKPIAPSKTEAQTDADVKAAGAKKRAETIKAIMGRTADLFQQDIEGQPLERLGGLTEYFSMLPKNERFNAAAQSMLPLIRPLVAQSAKEGDSDKEMQVFMAYIPQASDSDIAIKEKLSLLEMLIGGMVDGKVPSQITQEIAQTQAQAEGNTFTYGGKTFTKGETTAELPQSNTTMDGIGQGLGSMAEGVGNVLGIIGNPLNATINALAGTNLSTNLGQTTREALGLPANTDPMGNAIIQGATGAMTGAGLAGMASRALPGMVGQAAEALAAQPIQQVAGGAGAGAGAEFAREQGGGTVAQIAAGLAGGIAGARGAGVAEALSAPRVAVPTAVQAAERANIPVMTSDIAPPQTFMGKNLQQAGERIPLAGTGGLRASQQDARVAAVKDVLTGYGAGAEGLPDKVWRSVSTKRSSELTKYADMKKQAIAAVNSAGEVPVAATNAAIDDELARLSRISPEGFAPAISILRRWKNDIQGKSLEDIEVLRKQIGEEFKSPELAAVSGEAQKSLNRIYNPLREDMGAFIRANGGSREANKWMIANRRLSELAGDLDKQALKSVLRNGEATPEAVNNLLFSQKRSDVAALYRALTPEGRANARAAIMDKVFQDIGGDMEAISPEKFITAVRKQGNAIGVMFSPEEAQRIGGLIKALKLTRRAGEAGVVTSTGQQGVAIAGLSGLTGLVGGLLGGAATGGTTAAVTAATAGAIGGLARVMESRAARNILLQLNKAKPQEEAALVKRFIAAINASKE